MRPGILNLTVAGLCAFVGGGVGLFLAAQLEKPLVAQGPARATPVVTDLVAVADRFELVAARVAPAVVYVEATKSGSKSSGSGKVVEESGSGVMTRWPSRRDHLVLTNNHVVTGARPEQIIVQLADGRVLHPTRVWTDPESDVAVLSMEGMETLPTAVLGDSDRMRVGHWVLAIGSPFGLNQTVTHGILSARERGQISLGETIRIKDFFQTDAAINPGSSGGPLVNLNGEVIGINTAIASPNGNNTGVAFSIPINQFKRVVDQLLQKGSVSRGYIGIQLSQAFEPADALKLGLDRLQGALIEAVYPGTPAEKAGLRVGDVVLELDQSPVRNENQLINAISAAQPGKTLNVVVWRDRRRVNANVVVGDWSEGQDRLRPR
jgi:serine protease Do